MSKPEFDFSKYVQVPDQWLENALNIPNTAQDIHRKKPVLRRYVAAASIVLVVALSAGAYFLFRNNTPIAVAPLPTAATTEAAVDSTPPPSEYPTIPATAASTQQPTEKPSQPSTQKPTVTAQTASSAPSQPTDAPSPLPTAAQPTAQPSTQRPTVRPTTPTAPTESPTFDKATEPAPETTPPVETPTENEWFPDEIELYASLPDEIRLNEEYVYCRIEDEQGKRIGDENLYSQQHRIKVYEQYDVVVYVPNSAYRGLKLPHGDYTYYFYDRTGSVFASGVFHID